MEIGIEKSSPITGQVCWDLFDTLDVQKGLREKGGKIDFSLTLEDAEYWVEHPEMFPEEFKNQTVFLWNTFDSSHGLRRIMLMFWLIDEVELYPLLV